MNVEYECRRHVRREPLHRGQPARFVCSVVALWAACATGIYLIGPPESELVSDAAAAKRPPPADRAVLTTAAYHP